MKILHLISSYNHASAYEENHTIGAQLILGHDVLVASAHLSNLPSSSSGDTNLSFHLLRCINITSNHLILRGVNRLLQTYQPDVLYLHGLDTFSFYFLSASCIPSFTRIYGDIHESGVHPLFRKKSLFARLRSSFRSINYLVYLLKISSIVPIFYSRFTFSLVSNIFVSLYYSLSGSKQRVFPMPSSPNPTITPTMHPSFHQRASFLMNNKTFNIVLAGKFTQEKCISESVSYLLSSVPSTYRINISFAGLIDETLSTSLENLSNNFPNAHLQFLGMVTKTELSKIYQNSHASAWITNVSVGVNESIDNLCPVITSMWGLTFYPSVPQNLVFDDNELPLNLSPIFDNLLALWSNPHKLIEYFKICSYSLSDCSALSMQTKIIESF